MDEQTYPSEGNEQEANSNPSFYEEGSNPAHNSYEKCSRCGKLVPNLVHYDESTIKTGGRSLSFVKDSHLVCVDCYQALQADRRKHNRTVLLIGVVVAAVALIILCTTNTDVPFFMNAAVALVVGVCASVPFLKKGRVIAV